MSRYVARPVAINPRANDWWDNGPLLPALTVDGGKEVDTGLVDSMGKAIIHIPPPIGFGRDAEW